MNKKEIFIVHQYLEKSHFKSLYDCADKYDYEIKGFIVLDVIDMLRRFRNEIKSNHRIIKPMKILLNDLFNLFKLRFIKNKILIVGIAPYDRLLNKYHKCFKKNNSIYFTSWQFWDGSNFPMGDLKNKACYENLLKDSFKGAACVSKLTESSMKNFFTNTVVVNHAININEYKKKKINFKNEFKKYIYLGQLIERKNISVIINYINNSKLDFQFDFAGKGILENEIIKLSNSDNRVNYLGRLTKSEIKDKLREYDYMVLPSKEEPFGIVLIESLVAGVPCIVSNALGPREIITDGDNGFIFDKEDQNEFCKIMNKSLEIKEDEYIELSKNAIISSQKYDSDNLIKQWIKVIEKGSK